MWVAAGQAAPLFIQPAARAGRQLQVRHCRRRHVFACAARSMVPRFPASPMVPRFPASRRPSPAPPRSRREAAGGHVGAGQGASMRGERCCSRRRGREAYMTHGKMEHRCCTSSGQGAQERSAIAPEAQCVSHGLTCIAAGGVMASRQQKNKKKTGRMGAATSCGPSRTRHPSRKNVRGNGTRKTRQ